MHSPRHCPRCKGPQAARSHRRPWEYALVFFRPYRCVACQHRFYAFHLPGTTRAEV